MLGFPLLEFIYLVLGFGFLIFVHELGHFVVAKWAKIRCPQFAIGFGQAMFSYRKGIGVMRGTTEREYERLCIEKLQADGVEPEETVPSPKKKKGEENAEADETPRKQYSAVQIYNAGDALGLAETEYRLNYLPLGGYVKMMGQEDMDPNAKSEHPNAYNNKSIGARACVISAGVVMNMIFGAIFLAIAFLMGVSFPKATVGLVQPGMPAATTFAEGHEGDLRYLGLREGDIITSVNGEAPEDFKDVAIAVALSSSDSVVQLGVQRHGEDEELIFRLTPERQKGGERLLSAGFQAGPGLDIAAVKDAKNPVAKWYEKRVKEVPPAQRVKHDYAIRIAAVNGQAIKSYPEYLQAFSASGGKPVQVTFADEAGDDLTKTFEVGVLPTLVRYPDKPANLLGLVPAGKLMYVDEESPAAKAKMKPGDILVQVGDLKWPVDTLAIASEIEKDKTKPLKVVVLRDGTKLDLGKVTPKKGKLGIIVEPELDKAIIAAVLDGQPAEALDGTDGFMPGTQLKAVNGQAVSNWSDIQRAMLDYVNQPTEGRASAIKLSFQLPVAGAQPEETDLVLSDDSSAAILAVEWVPDHSAYIPQTEFVLVKAEGVGEALLIGVDKSHDFVMQTYITLLRLIQGDVKLYNLRGPVGIISTGTQVAKQGIPYLLFFLGLISINLAVINFLPIPIVDGGHMVFLLWEKISGKPPNEKVQAAALYAGLALIGFVFIATFYFDVMREISRFF